MAPEFRSSFIPKGATVQNDYGNKESSLIGSVALVFLIITILSSFGLWGYSFILNNNIESIKSELSIKESSIDLETIENMARFSRQLDGAKSILARHLAVSGFFDLLQDVTPSSVYFTSFSYNIDNSGKLTVSMPGESENYSGVALLDRELKKSKYIRSVNFGNLISENGKVSFELSVELDQEIVLYKIEDRIESSFELGSGTGEVVKNEGDSTRSSVDASEQDVLSSEVDVDLPDSIDDI